MGDLNFWIFLFIFVVLPFLQWVAKKINEQKQSSHREVRRSARRMDLEEWDPDLVQQFDDPEVLARAEQEAKTGRSQRGLGTPSETDAHGPMREIRDFLSQLKEAGEGQRPIEMPTPSAPTSRTPPPTAHTPMPERTAPLPPTSADSTPSVVSSQIGGRHKARSRISIEGPSTHAYDVDTKAYRQQKRRPGHAAAIRHRKKSDLRRYFIWSEILSPPVALREKPPGSFPA